MDVKEYIQNRVEKNKLPVDIDEAVAVVESYSTIYDLPYEARFYMYLLNTVGNALSSIDLEKSEVLGWLKPHKGKNTGITSYQFESPEDYSNWLSVRKYFYAHIDENTARLLNFVEMSTLDFISDVYITCDYMAKKEKQILLFKKTGIGVDVDSKVSFIKYLSQIFGSGFTYYPQ